MSNIRERFKNRETLFGGWTSIPHPAITEMFCSIMQADFVGIDIEHTSVDLNTVQQMMTAGQASGKAILPRVGSHNGEQIRRVLDAGADGVIVPQVNSKEDVDQILNWIKYPPEGKRGFGVSRAQGYGAKFDSYIETWNEKSVFIPQIESIQAVENIDSILANDCVDGAMIGPFDISGSLGVPGKLDDPKVLKACDRVIEACHKHKKACGNQVVEATAETLQGSIDKGYSFVIVSSDLFLLWKWAERTQKLMEDARKSN